METETMHGTEAIFRLLTSNARQRRNACLPIPPSLAQASGADGFPGFPRELRVWRGHLSISDRGAARSGAASIRPDRSGGVLDGMIGWRYGTDIHPLGCPN